MVRLLDEMDPIKGNLASTFYFRKLADMKPASLLA